MKTIDVRSANVAFLGALEVTDTPHGVIPRRVPAWATAQIGDPSLDVVSQMPSGVRLRIRSTTRRVELDVLVTSLKLGDRDVAPSVFELDVGGSIVATASTHQGHVLQIANGSTGVGFEKGEPTTVVFDDLGSALKDMDVWLPVASIVEVRDVRVNDDALVMAVGASDQRRWLNYGSSISHCAGAASPTVTWPARVARQHDLDLINLGLAGQCFLDPSVARVIANTPVQVITLKVASNVISADAMRERIFGSLLHGFLDTIRERQPTTPIVVVSPIFSPLGETTPGPFLADASGKNSRSGGDAATDSNKMTMVKMREHCRRIVETRRNVGDQHLLYVDGLTLFSESDRDDMPDLLHPNDAGNERIAKRFSDAIFTATGVLAHENW